MNEYYLKLDYKKEKRIIKQKITNALTLQSTIKLSFFDRLQIYFFHFFKQGFNKNWEKLN